MGRSPVHVDVEVAVNGPYRSSSHPPEPDPFPHVDERVKLVRSGSWSHGNISAEWQEGSGVIKLIVRGNDARDTSIRTNMSVDDVEQIVGALKRTIELARKPAPETEG